MLQGGLRIFLALWLLVFAGGAAMAAKRVALVIGNSAYTNAPALANPKNDAQDMAAALKALGFTVILGTDLDKRAMDRKILEFAGALSGADAGVFHYSGHGLQVAGVNYLVPVDASLESAAALDFEAVRLDLVQRTMEREAKTNILFLDACRNNPLTRNLARALGTRSTDIGRGLAPAESGVGTLVSFSTQPGNVALDGTGRNSPYSGPLAKAIGTPGEDILSILTAVRNEVLTATGQKQVPWENHALTAKFYFNPSAAAPAQLQAPLSADAQAWSLVQATTSEAVLEEFIQRFPDSVYAGFAKARLEELKRSKNSSWWPWSSSPRKEPEKPKHEKLVESPSAGGPVAPALPKDEQTAAVMPSKPAALEPEKPQAETKQTGDSEEKRSAADAADDSSFANAKGLSIASLLEDYLKKYSRHRDEAKSILATLDGKAFAKAEEAQTVEAFRDYLDEWPVGQYASRAEAKIVALRKGEELESCGDGLVVSVATGKKPCIKPGSGQSFKDCPDCPEMVIVPAGSFTMGSPGSEPEHQSGEGPQHEVRIGEPFAVGRFAVTRDEFEAFVKDSGHSLDGGCYFWDGSKGKQDSAKSFRSPGFAQTGSHPVVCVNWNDAQAYVAWLSKKTAKSYRLLSEAEREYVARAGTKTPFWWGSSITPEQANYNGSVDPYKGGGSKGEYRQKTMPVKSFKPNPWGLYQVHGNVWDWVEDCWHGDYHNAPSDGSAWTTGECSRRVLRGGSWLYIPQGLRAAYRNNYGPLVRGNYGGFRVALGWQDLSR